MQNDHQASSETAGLSFGRDEAREWVDSVAWHAHIAHGWASDGTPFPMKIWPSEKEAIDQVLSFAAKFGPPPKPSSP